MLGKDKQEFQQLRLALYGPKTGELAYLPAQVYTVKPNGETEQWKMTEPKVNIQGITEKVFQYENVPGFRFQQAPGSRRRPGGAPRSADAAGEAWAVTGSREVTIGLAGSLRLRTVSAETFPALLHESHNRA